MAEGFGRRLMLSVDVAKYGPTDDQQKDAIQVGLLGVLGRAAAKAGLDRLQWDRQPTGDGEFAVLPGADELEPVVVDDFVRELNTALTAHNRPLRDEFRLRMRLAVHFGVATEGANGYSSQGPVAVNRLLDGEVVKSFLEKVPEANLVVVLSRQVFCDTVQQGHTSLSPNRFRKVHVRNKDFLEDAYVFLPGQDVTLLVDEDQAEPVPVSADKGNAQSSGPDGVSNISRSSTTTINGDVNNLQGVIGMSWTES